MHLKRPIWVVKVGGRLCEDEAMRLQVAAACSRVPHTVVLVHGGGCLVSDMQHKLGITAQFVEGRRVTASADMAVVEMVLSGAINKALVRAVQANGKSAVGLSGLDGEMMRCTLVPQLGAVGMPVVVNTEALRALLAINMMPVVSPVSSGPDGEPVNVNADEFACALAIGLAAERLLLISDVPAVRVGGTAQQVIFSHDVESLVAAGEVTAGMVPKLRAAKAAVERGVAQVRIAGFHDDLSAVGGTVVRRTSLAMEMEMLRVG